MYGIFTYIYQQKYIECLGTGKLDSTTHSPRRKASDQMPSDPTVKLQIVVSSKQTKDLSVWCLNRFLFKAKISIESVFLLVIIYPGVSKMKDLTRMPWKSAIFLSDTFCEFHPIAELKHRIRGGKPTKIVLDHMYCLLVGGWTKNQPTWNMCSSNWIISPCKENRGKNLENMFHIPPPSLILP